MYYSTFANRDQQLAYPPYLLQGKHIESLTDLLEGVIEKYGTAEWTFVTNGRGHQES